MKLQDFYRDLPAIWLVFAGSYLDHKNSPSTVPDQREKSLVDLLRHYLQVELVNLTTLEQNNKHTLTQLTSLIELLELWSQDLDLIYQIRQSGNKYLQTAQLAQRFLQRIRKFENCTIIPNGLIAAKHTDSNENISLAILKKHSSGIDWVQIDPGSAYHQRCLSLTGEKSNAYLEITEINPTDITEDWLTLLVGLKAINPGGYYKDVSLYECLLAQLNGKTVFKSQPDEDFVFYTHTSPTHTWQVIAQSFRYLLHQFFGETYSKIYWQLIIGFKLFLLEQTFTAYQNKDNEQMQQCHYLLQEMCRDIAQHTLEHGDQKQIETTLNRINAVKAVIEQHLNQHYQKICNTCKLDEPQISSLSFVSPTLVDYTSHTSDLNPSSLQADSLFRKPTPQDDMVDYLKQFKHSFINKLIDSNQIKDVALLTYGIETIFIDYLANTTILQKSHDPFSSDNAYLASTLKELAEIYYGCQGRMVKQFLSEMIYQPQFYAKNLIIQFYAYAAIAALNLRDKNIGSLLTQYNLSIAVSGSLTFDKIMFHLVIDDPRWLKALFTIETFFEPTEDKETLFSYQKFKDNNFKFDIGNDAEEHDTEVKFAYRLLQKDSTTYQRFINNYRYLEDEKLNQKWQALAYSDDYLPSIYCLLSKVAFTAKAALTGFPFPSWKNDNLITTSWSSYQTSSYYSYRDYWKSIINFEIDRSYVSISHNSDQFASYILKKSGQWFWSVAEDSYQRLIIRKDNIGTTHAHFLENEIIAMQHEKPATMDRIRYMQLGFLQSESLLKIERLYIAIKQRQLDFTHEHDAILIKQTLFETSSLCKTKEGYCSLLELTVYHIPNLIHQLGLLCIEKALAMKLRLTQHQAIGEILEVALGLLAFYPSAYKNEFIESISNIYTMLNEVLAQPPTHLGESTLLYLNAYLIISAQAKPKLTSTETFTILTALLEIQNYKINGFTLDNNVLLRAHMAGFKLCPLIEYQLEQHQTLLNNLMLKVIPQWNQASAWQRNHDGLLFTCGNYAVEPLIGKIYFQNRPIISLPDIITEHTVFKDYFGKTSFAVLPSLRKFNENEIGCYLSVNRAPTLRLTLISKDLLVEELINEHYQLYVPAQQLLSNTKHPSLLYQQPLSGEKFRHWVVQDKILIKNQQRQTIYQWNLQGNTILSLQHQGYIVPLEQVKDSYFKVFIQRIELSVWIEIIAKQPPDNADINIQSLHFPRLGLNFDYRQGKFFSRQIHDYYLAEEQNLNILLGFSNYLVLEKRGQGSNHKQIKVIIPHRKIINCGHFYDKSITVDFNTVPSFPYFIYDVDQKLGLLKASSINAQLYLALLYYCSASLDNYDMAHCNAYHLARENLEICWKDQPFDTIELDIIELLLSKETLHDLHCNRIAIYLKVVSLLSYSLRLSFLYTDETALHNKKRSEKLLKECSPQLPYFFALYLRDKTTIFTRIKLSTEEEQEVVNYLFLQEHPYTQQFQAYSQLYLKHQSQVSLFSHSKKSYKEHYQQLFAHDQLSGTSFLTIFKAHIDVLSFPSPKKSLNFSGTIGDILVERFRLELFIPLYKLAQSSTISLTKYRYLLHHMVLRAKILKDKFPPSLVMMLARALLIVAENPEQFPKSPIWFEISDLQFNLTQRSLTKDKVCQDFPNVSLRSYSSFESYEKDRKRDESENDSFWYYFSRYDLDGNNIPLNLPSNPNYFTLNYERYISFSNSSKKEIVKKVYLQAARNDAMYQFFVNVLQQCDTLKYTSTMGWTIAPFINQAITDTITEDKTQPQQKMKRTNLEKWTIPQQPLVELAQFFIIKQQPLKAVDFLFEQSLKEHHNGYQQQFYRELKESWLAYQGETKTSYHWLNSESVNQLEKYLQTKQIESSDQAKQIWYKIIEQFKHRTNSELLVRRNACGQAQ